MEFYPIFELNSVTSGEKCCASCGGRNPTRKLTFQTVMYQYETLKMTDSNQSVQVRTLSDTHQCVVIFFYYTRRIFLVVSNSVCVSF